MRLSLWNRFATRYLPSSSPRQAGRRKSTDSIKLCLELLETRELLSAAHAALAVPTHILHPSHGSVSPLSSSGPTGYTPTQIRHGYGFDQIKFNNGTVAGDGTGMTIAIVDAYDDPNIASDLKAFDTQFGLPGNSTDNNLSFFTKVNQYGSTSSYPAASGTTGWSEETSLDVEWAHAIAPGAKILLVEANSASFGNLLTGVDTSNNWSGVVAVSMSWGGGEFSGETSYDSHFTHANVTYLVSSGDNGAPDSYPSSSPNVVSVGGTTLKLDNSNNWSTETGWAGSGGGISAYESQPSYENNGIRPANRVLRGMIRSSAKGGCDHGATGVAGPWERKVVAWGGAGLGAERVDDSRLLRAAWAGGAQFPCLAADVGSACSRASGANFPAGGGGGRDGGSRNGGGD